MSNVAPACEWCTDGQQQVTRGFDDRLRIQSTIKQNFADEKPILDVGATSTGVAAAPPSEEFTKELARLQEMIALHGKVGEAAKLSYQIQIGSLDALSESEQKELLQLAARVDQLNANTAAMKEFEERQKALNDEYQKFIEGTLEYISITANAPKSAYQQQLDDYIESLGKAGRQQDNYNELLHSLGIYVEDVQLSYEQMYAAIDERRQKDLISERQAAEARVAVAQMEKQARFAAVEELTWGLSTLMSSHHRKAFEIGKAAAIANASITQGEIILNALSVKPWYLGLAQAASAAATVYSQIEQIKGVQFNGYQQGGYTGNGGISDVAGVVHGREYVMDAASTARIGVGNLDALREGGDLLSNSVQLNVINQTGIPMQAEWVSREEVRLIVAQGISQQTPKIVAGQLAVPNSTISKSLGRNTKTARNR